MTRSVVLIAAHGAQALDIVGPAAVFAAANDALGRAAYCLTTATLDGAHVSTSAGIQIRARPLRKVRASKHHTVLVMGGDRQCVEAMATHLPLRRWLLRARNTAARIAAVCNGAFALAAAGLLDHKRATTHWASAKVMAEMFPAVNVDPEAIYVIDGQCWTSAGVTCGIDMALAMVGADEGADIAAAIAQRLVVYQHRPGTQSQFSPVLRAQSRHSNAYADLIAWIEANLKADLSGPALAARAGQANRTFQRRFARLVGNTPGAFVEDLRLERAKALIATGLSMKAVAAECGFGDAARLALVFHRRFGLAPTQWRTLHEQR